MTPSTDDRRAASSARRGTSKGTCFSSTLGPDDTLGDGWLRDEEGSRDLLGLQTSDQTKRERNLCLGCEHGMARDEDQAQQVIAEIVVESRIQIWHGPLFRTKLATKLSVLALEQSISAEVINRPMFRRGHQPGARVIGDAQLRPLFERGDQSVLCEIFGQSDIAHDPRQSGDESRRLDPPDCVDGAMYVSIHCHPSHHLQCPRASPDALGHEECFYAMRDRSFICCAKSSGPKIWRTSVSPSHPGQCFL